MDPVYLNEEEIAYELALRHVSSLSSLARRAKAIRLRALIQEDEINDRIHLNSTHVMDFATNFGQCKSNIHELLALIESAYQRKEIAFLAQARSRLLHYRERLAILEPPLNQTDNHAILCLLVQFAFEDVEDVLGRGRKQVNTSASSSVSGGAIATGAIPRTNNQNPGNSSGTGELQDQATGGVEEADANASLNAPSVQQEANASLSSTNPFQQPNSSAAINQTPEEILGRSQQQSNNQQTTDAQPFNASRNNQHLQQWERFGQQFSQQHPTQQSTSGQQVNSSQQQGWQHGRGRGNPFEDQQDQRGWPSGRGRGAPATEQQQQQGWLPGRGRGTPLAQQHQQQQRQGLYEGWRQDQEQRRQQQTNRMHDQIGNVPYPPPRFNLHRVFEEEAPPPYNNPHQATDARQGREQQDQLRDELINLLLRRERGEMQPTQARTQMEERRTCKAIHNWPLRYKGEKDSSSLNMFLQRVEIFASSEGITEQILLRNIKHLLLDDALTWYVHAFVEGELTSWDDFKVQIRREFLPASYAFSIRIEAYHRMQGESETFSKFYQDIKTLFNHVQPRMTEEEKLFVVKKNMNSTYAPVAAAQQATTMDQLVKACKEFDELKRMQDSTRKVNLPRSSLLEPSLATPVATQRTSRPFTPSQRFGRINAIEGDGLQQLGAEAQEEANAEQDGQDEENIDERIQQLTQQVCALRTQFNRRDGRPSQQIQSSRQASVANPVAAPRSEQTSAMRQQLMCWNCDESGHRFMDCPKEQAMLFYVFDSSWKSVHTKLTSIVQNTVM